MTTRTEEFDLLEKQTEKFEQEYPKVAEALRLFNITMEQYERILHILDTPFIYSANATNRGTPYADME